MFKKGLNPDSEPMEIPEPGNYRILPNERPSGSSHQDLLDQFLKKTDKNQRRRFLEAGLTTWAALESEYLKVLDKTSKLSSDMRRMTRLLYINTRAAHDQFGKQK